MIVAEDYTVALIVKSIAPTAFCPNLTNKIGVQLKTLSRKVITITVKKTVKIPILKAPGCFTFWLRR